MNVDGLRNLARALETGDTTHLDRAANTRHHQRNPRTGQPIDRRKPDETGDKTTTIPGNRPGITVHDKGARHAMKYPKHVPADQRAEYRALWLSWALPETKPVEHEEHPRRV